MLTIEDINPDSKLSVIISIAFAKDVLHIFESKCPDDMRPREAIEASEKYLSNHITLKELGTASNSAFNAAYDANKNIAEPASEAAYAAGDAACAARNAFNIKEGNDKTFYSARADVTSAMLSAAYACSAGTRKLRQLYAHSELLKILPMILRYKIDNKQAFGGPDKVFEYLSDEDKELFLFNLDILR